ncbi:lantibiotic modifying enzyme [Spongiactinospora rosea]|uniref:Lantibiotic modifying enzyme n=1 Tax=Spongiactinospora rosea TaxID=2248750 RepID=A0A366LSP0_9ACTN|nr:lanthionine synthetase C family protein [Spongiactinospora rosea]RBQ16941.1 lantibiotic modifying enzyme [Spongiactinospora rosea]
MPAPGPRRRIELDRQEETSVTTTAIDTAIDTAIATAHPGVGAAAEQALAATDRVAEHLADPASWAAMPADGRRWPQSLAGGAAGIALLHIERAHSGRGAPQTAHAWLRTAACGPLTAASNAGLFFGVPTLAFLTRAAAGPSSCHRGVPGRLDEAVARITRARLDDARARLRRGERPLMKEFDLIRGLTGLGAYYLSRHPGHPLLGEVLAYLVTLTEPHDDELPGWWTSVSPSGEPHADYPRGHGNLGLSHGIGSVLALLSLAVLRDKATAKDAGAIKGAIERICAWIDQWQQHDDAGRPWWPGLITHDQVRERRVDPALRPRPSWCYGISGTARAQQLAGLALGDVARRQHAEGAMLAVLRDPAEIGRLPEAGLCHGLAGVLQSAWRMATDASTPHLTRELPALAAQLTALVTALVTGPAAIGTFASEEFLDGAAGAALALHTFATGTPPASGWDAVLLLSA